MNESDTQSKVIIDYQQEPEVVIAIKQNISYTLRLIGLLKEQLDNFDIGKYPDYALMTNIIDYLCDSHNALNNPVKRDLIQFIINLNPESNASLNDLLEEKPVLEKQQAVISELLSSLVQQASILKEEQLRVLGKDFIEFLESHTEVEFELLPLKCRTELTTAELSKFAKAYKESLLEYSNKEFEQKYQYLYKVLSNKIEAAANDFAMADLVSIGSLIGGLEPYTLGAVKVSKIVKDYSYRLYIANYQCYKDLFSASQTSKLDYINKPVNCFKDCYGEYLDGLHEISEVVKETKKKDH